MRAAVLFFCVVTLLVLTSGARAHMLKPETALNKLSPRNQLAYWKASSWHAITAVRWYRRHPGLGTWRDLQGHRWLHRYSERMIGELRRLVLLTTRPPHAAAWACIHPLEGSWTNPNYGGLGLMIATQRQFGPAVLGFRSADAMFRARGTADHWAPREQEWVAEAVYRAFGFYPWPATARACGLI